MPWTDIDVILPNLKRRLSGVTSTVLRLVPVQEREIGLAVVGWPLPGIAVRPLRSALFVPRDRWRVWHARRNNEMVLGLILRHVFRRRVRLLFTSAAQRVHTGFTKALIARQDAVVATSEKAARYLDRPATVIMHGVDTTVFTPSADRAALRTALGLPVDACIIGCFGRIRAQKGVDLLVEAALTLCPSRPDLHVVFSGRVAGKHRAFYEGLQAKIAAAGLSGRITFRGEVPWADLVRLHQAMDLYAAPSRTEGFGLTPLEAMACGTPVVAADAGAYAEMVEPGLGTIVPPGDAAALTAALATWVDDPARRAAARPACRQHVQDRFAIAREAEALIAVYRQMLAEPNRRR